MAHAKKRKIEVGNTAVHQYYCGNCDEWHTPRNPEKPDFPKNCKKCNTVLKFRDE